jgi:uncharacterized membrane protein affecting hemolysin expression
MNNRFSNISLSQQLAIISAGLCLLVSLALVALGAISTRHMQMTQQEEYGTSLAKQVAARVTPFLESGDMLSVSASLQHFLANSSAQTITISDAEGKLLGQAGDAHGLDLHQYTALVHIESDLAGQIVVTIDANKARAAQLRSVLSMLGLAVLLSLAVYGLSRRFGQRLGNMLSSMTRKIPDAKLRTSCSCCPGRSTPCLWTCCAPAVNRCRRRRTIAPQPYSICTFPVW